MAKLAHMIECRNASSDKNNSKGLESRQSKSTKRSSGDMAWLAKLYAKALNRIDLVLGSIPGPAK